jgi:hypothetical protein
MLWTVVKVAAKNWSEHKDSRQGAALAYYSVFSLGPIIVIAIAIAGFFFGREAVDGQVASSIKDMRGDIGAQAVQAMLADAGRPQQGLSGGIDYCRLDLGLLFVADNTDGRRDHLRFRQISRFDQEPRASRRSEPIK